MKCALCDGLAQVRRSDLIALLAGANLRENLKKMADFTSLVAGDEVVRGLRPGEFGKEVHNWNPTLALWRKSKE